DSVHYKTDLLVNVGVIIALLLAMYGWAGFDPIFAIAIAFYILHSAWEIASGAIDQLMDKELSDEDRADIKQLATSHPEVKGIHDLRTRKAGLTNFIQFHLELDGNLSLMQAHTIADEVEAIDSALASAQEGDLLLIFGDAITRCWKQIIHFNKENQKSSKSEQPQNNSNSNVILNEDEKEFLASADLIKDEKGVRLARAEEND
ncbi:MAG: cation diffusion facilitator family transporter, partial [Kangiellaceae bacterium]|nr:cation diffusion facilitator family transporter [Kangiellaceae bacterium]